MTQKLQPGRVFLLLLCLLLGCFSVLEAAHGHAGAPGHCGLCLLTHTPALLPALPVLAAAPQVLSAAAAALPLPLGCFPMRLHRIRPPPLSA